MRGSPLEFTELSRHLIFPQWIFCTESCEEWAVALSLCQTVEQKHRDEWPAWVTELTHQYFSRNCRVLPQIRNYPSSPRLPPQIALGQAAPYHPVTCILTGFFFDFIHFRHQWNFFVNDAGEKQKQKLINSEEAMEIHTHTQKDCQETKLPQVFLCDHARRTPCL